MERDGTSVPARTQVETPTVADEIVVDDEPYVQAAEPLAERAPTEPTPQHLRVDPDVQLPHPATTAHHVDDHSDAGDTNEPAHIPPEFKVPETAFIRCRETLYKVSRETYIKSFCEEKFGFQPTDIQVKACQEQLLGTDIFLAAPTGSGKSLCVLLPLLIAKSVNPAAWSIYCSPLLSLNSDFSMKCESYGLRVLQLLSSTPDLRSTCMWSFWLSSSSKSSGSKASRLGRGSVRHKHDHVIYCPQPQAICARAGIHVEKSLPYPQRKRS